MANNMVGGKKPLMLMFMTTLLFLLVIVSTTHARVRHSRKGFELRNFKKVTRPEYINPDEQQTPPPQRPFYYQTEKVNPHGLSGEQSPPTADTFSFNNPYQQPRKYQTVQEQYSFDAATTKNNVDAYQPQEQYYSQRQNQNEINPEAEEEEEDEQEEVLPEADNDGDVFFSTNSDSKYEQLYNSTPPPPYTLQDQIDAYFKGKQRKNSAAQEQDQYNRYSNNKKADEELQKFLNSQKYDDDEVQQSPPVNQNQAPPAPQTFFFLNDQALNAYLDEAAANQQETTKAAAAQTEEEEDSLMNDSTDTLDDEDDEFEKDESKKKKTKTTTKKQQGNAFSGNSYTLTESGQYEQVQNQADESKPTETRVGLSDTRDSPFSFNRETDKYNNQEALYNNQQTRQHGNQFPNQYYQQVPHKTLTNEDVATEMFRPDP